jgi:6-phosphogluconolactonase
MAHPLLVLSLAALTGSLGAGEATWTAYVGTSGPGALGVHAVTLGRATGKLGQPRLLAEAKGASWVTPHPKGRVLYATGEGREGRVLALRLVGEGKAELINAESSGGAGPCHLAVDPSGRTLLVANYGGGSVASLPLRPDGSLGPAVSVIRHQGSGPSERRQKGPHAHGVHLDRAGRVHVPDLGADRIFVHGLDPATARLAQDAAPAAVAAPGAGPRHLDFHPSGRFAYVCNELDLTVTAYGVDAATGTLRALHSLPTLPAGASPEGASTAEILVHPSGKSLYVSNRGHNSLAVYAVADDGRLSLLQHQPGVPAKPRGFGISPCGRWLICAGQDAGTLRTYAVAADGRLSDTGHEVAVAAAACVVFAPGP